jgi:hypothetical protein
MAEMKRTHGESFTVGLDDNSGRVVIIRNNREVIGSLSRDDSVKFGQDIIEWIPQFMRPTKPKEAEAASSVIALDG